MYVNRKLPKADAEIREKSIQLGLVSTSKKSVLVKLLEKKPESELFIHEVKSIRAV